MFSSIKEKLAGENNEEDVQDSELIDDIENEVSGGPESNEISQIEESLAHVEDLEQAIEEEISGDLEELNEEDGFKGTSKDAEDEKHKENEKSDQVDSALEPADLDEDKERGVEFESEKNVETPEKVSKSENVDQEETEIKDDLGEDISQKDQIKHNLSEAEDSMHSPTLPGPGNSPKNLQSQVRDFEEKIVSEESRELAEINDLEQRVEKMELRSTKDLEERIQALEQKIESMQTVEKFRDRLEELEEVVEDQGPDDVENLENKIDQLWEAFDEELESVEKEENRTIRKLRLLWQALELNIGELQSNIDSNNKEVEELWEAMDEEMMDVEARIHDNKEEIEDLYSIVLELSELVKDQME